MLGIIRYPDEFPDPKHEGSASEDEAPVRPAQRNHVEHLAAEGDDDVLPGQNEERHHPEAPEAGPHAGKRALVRIKCLGIEHVPELEKDKDGEKQGQFIPRQFMFR